MIKTEIKETSINAPRLFMEKFSKRYLIFRSFFGLSFLTLAYLFFSPVVRLNSDLARLFLVIFGSIVLLMCLFMFFEYIIKTVRLQNSNTNNYSALLAVNTFTGLIIPLLYVNLILSTIMKALGSMNNYGTFLCHIRNTIVNFYYWNNIYFLINQLVGILIVSALFLFIFGGFIERLYKRK